MAHRVNFLVEPFATFLILKVLRICVPLLIIIYTLLFSVPYNLFSNFNLGWCPTNYWSLLLDDELIRCSHVRSGFLRLEVVLRELNCNHLPWSVFFTPRDVITRELFNRGTVLRLNTWGQNTSFLTKLWLFWQPIEDTAMTVTIFSWVGTTLSQLSALCNVTSPLFVSRVVRCQYKVWALGLTVCDSQDFTLFGLFRRFLLTLFDTPGPFLKLLASSRINLSKFWLALDIGVFPLRLRLA